MILFFDRSLGTRIPTALQRLRAPAEIRYHDKEFHKAAPDDVWLPVVGSREWFVIGHDNYHRKANELAALRQYNIGCFYLWGDQKPLWEKTQVLVKAFDKIIERTADTPRPFVYRIDQHGRLRTVAITVPE